VSGLLLKDLRVLRPWWWLIVPGHLLFAANGIVSPELFFAMNVALAWAWTAILIIVDWTQDADRFVASLPVGREEVVKARYAGALGAAVLGTILYAVYGRVILSFATGRLRERWADAPGWESAAGLLGFFLTVWLVSVVSLPFYFRWGLAKGTWLFVATLAPAAVVVVWLHRQLPLPDAAASLGTSAGPGLAGFGSLILAAALGWVSLRLSARSYAARDL
jgi:hypothetical protein